MIRTIDTKELTEIIKEMCIAANHYLSKDMDIALEFVNMVYNYAMELQGNVSKYTTGYITEITKESFKRGLIKLDDLYVLREEDIVKIYENNFPSWKNFKEAKEIVRCDTKPDGFYVSMDVKKRNVIPLILWNGEVKRITDVSIEAKNKYNDFNNFHDSKYAYVRTIKKL